jgi:hypothetical protein
MKKYIFLMIFGLISFISFAQLPGQYVAFVNDTTTDVETEYMVLAAPAAMTLNYTMGISLKPVNASGTATVVAAIQTSNDNTNWAEYGTPTTVNTAGTVSVYSWLLTDTPFKYYRLKLTSTGTGVTRFTGGLIIKKK